jgi:hypothetical protein
VNRSRSDTKVDFLAPISSPRVQVLVPPADSSVEEVSVAAVKFSGIDAFQASRCAGKADPETFYDASNRLMSLVLFIGN